MSARATDVYIENTTDFELILDSQSTKLCHGEWNPMPPSLISPHQRVHFRVQSHGFMTGDEAKVYYKTDAGDTVWFHVDNPFVGSDKCWSGASDGLKVINSCGSGNNNTDTFTLVLDSSRAATNREGAGPDREE